jgi:ABC-type glycerol-3-phosphate transport system permease component
VKYRKILGQLFFYLLIAVIAVYLLFPFYWSLVTALKTEQEAFLSLTCYVVSASTEFGKLLQRFSKPKSPAFTVKQYRRRWLDHTHQLAHRFVCGFLTRQTAF